MEMVKATGFAELSENEIQEVDGGSINWAMAFMLGGIALIPCNRSILISKNLW